jgi:hypothetical protein
VLFATGKGYHSTFEEKLIFPFLTVIGTHNRRIKKKIRRLDFDITMEAPR